MFFALLVEGVWGMECGVVLKNASLIEVSRHHLQSISPSPLLHKIQCRLGVESPVVWLVALIPTYAGERPLSRGLHCKGKARFCVVQ